MTVAETFILDTTINLAVFGDMELRIGTQYIAREGDHNSATFRIVRQPAALQSLVCRAEIETAAGKNYYLVVDGEFQLTQDISVPGPGRMQLVYSDGVDVMRKTSIAHFTVMPSINAVDPSDPEFQDGLAQLATAAFAAVTSDNSGFAFFNVAGQGVGFVPWPIGSGGALDEETANLLYLRLNGGNMMQSSIGIMGPNRGITWEASGVQGALYSTGTQLVMRLPIGDPPFVIEPNSGAAALRSPVLTQQAGDTRYVQPPALDAYLPRAGGQMTGPLISAMGTGLTNPGLGIGDNATGFYRAGASLLLSVSGALYTQYLASPPSMMVTVPLNMATNQITNVGSPDAAAAGNSMAMPRSYADARYLQPAVGGIVTGPLQVTQTPQIPTDATNKGYVDNAVSAVPVPRQPAPVVLREVGGDLPVSGNGNWVALTTPITFTNPSGDATVMCVSVMINATTGNVACCNLRINSQGTTLAERRAFIYGAQGSSGFTVQFYRSVFGNTVGPFTVEIQSIGGQSPAADFVVIGGIADGPRSQIAVFEVGPPA